MRADWIPVAEITQAYSLDPAQTPDFTASRKTCSGEKAVCPDRIVENPGAVCDRQIFNIGSPDNETCMRQMAELMRDIYAEKFRVPSVRLPHIVSVTAKSLGRFVDCTRLQARKISHHVSFPLR